MKIIKEGDKQKLLRIKKFECFACGCIVEADKNEYFMSDEFSSSSYTCNCPTCGGRMREIVMRGVTRQMN